MSFIHTIILGVVEGFTEFLPISSTAHLNLTSKILQLENSEFIKSFEISIQLGAILAVVFLYWKTLIFKWKINKKIVSAFIPTALIGLIFYKIVKELFLSTHIISSYALLIGGIVLVIFELFHKERGADLEQLENLSHKKAVIIGLFQSIAIIPGVSRAATTILGGMLLGIKRKTMVEFSFLLAIPTMAAATGLDLVKSTGNFSNENFFDLTIGFLVSFIMASVGIKFLIKLVQKNNFIAFGIYRIIVGVIFLLFIN